MHICSVLNIKICNKKKTISLGLDGFQTVSVLGRDEGYTVKYNPLPEGVPKGKAQRNSLNACAFICFITSHFSDNTFFELILGLYLGAIQNETFCLKSLEKLDVVAPLIIDPQLISFTTLYKKKNV